LSNETHNNRLETDLRARSPRSLASPAQPLRLEAQFKMFQ
jgi:hypothetical protein